MENEERREFIANFVIEEQTENATFTIERQSVNANFGIIPTEKDHDKLVNRDKADQHPISAITNLQEILEELQRQKSTFVYEQGIASNIWIIEHNLNKKPSITVVDSADTVIGLFKAEYNDLNKVTLYFNGEFVGKAYLN